MIQSIEKNVDRYSEVATESRSNENYQPYIVSTFNAIDLKKLGVLNLEEALSLVPGLDLAVDNINYKTPIFRGSNPVGFGQSKLFVDGVLVNDLFIGGYSSYLKMPLEIIKRIEVIRGGGDKLDGFNTYAGSIHVTTYAKEVGEFQDTDKVVFKSGSYKYLMGGFVKSYSSGDLRVFTDFVYQQDDKAISSGADAFSQGHLSLPTLGLDNRALSESGDAPLWLKNYALGLALSYKDLSIRARVTEHKQGAAYGINYALPQDDDYIELPSYYLDLSYKFKIDDFDISVFAGAKYDSFVSSAKLAPSGWKFIDTIRFSADPTDIAFVTFEDGFYGEHRADQRTLYQASTLNYSPTKDHKFSFGYRVSQDETLKVVTKTSDRATGDASLVDYSKTYSFFDESAKRESYTLFLTAKQHYSRAVSFVYGVDYMGTSYSSAGFAPRASLVYQNDSDNIFKAIYARSYRDPSWQEMFTKNNSARVGNKDLEPEVVDSFEVAYVRKFTSDNYLQTNIFFLKNRDQISNSAQDPEYNNKIDTTIYGFELEYRGNVTPNDRVYLSYSYVDGEDCNGNGLSNVAQSMLKGYYIYSVSNKLSTSLIGKYIGEKSRVEDDDRDALDAYATLDISILYDDSKSGYSVSFSLKNIFDATVKYPSVPNSYSDDYTQESRSYLLTVVKEF